LIFLFASDFTKQQGKAIGGVTALHSYSQVSLVDREYRKRHRKKGRVEFDSLAKKKKRWRNIVCPVAPEKKTKRIQRAVLGNWWIITLDADKDYTHIAREILFKKVSAPKGMRKETEHYTNVPHGSFRFFLA
jgi:hypothetical protein